MINDKFLKPYNPVETEDSIYKKWEESGFFNPDTCIEKGVCSKDADAFSIVLPPPNVTGVLHLGHATMLAIEDIMVRYNRMRGKRTLWVPGTDHAAIATQSVVEKALKKEGLQKHDLGREEFLKRVNEHVQNSHDTIESQIKKMGSSVDWSREAFTLDEKREVAVRTAFKQMYEDKLIYRGDRIVNWDPKGQTTVSDDEVVYKEEKTKFYYFKYGPFTIGTARPETKFGDKYVVIHPEDTRYKEYKDGQKLTVEWINGPIEATIIKDSAIDMEFGTGVMTITPSHSTIDFEIAERHNLDKEQVIDKYGKLLPIAGEFAGMKIQDAREKIVDKLKEKGLVEKIDENYIHSIATAERSGGLIEPQIMKQWFIDVNKEFKLKNSKLKEFKAGDVVTLKKLMKSVVNSKEIDILPERFEKIYYNWIDNLRDWNISRQIWYGHRVPVWYSKTSQNNNQDIYVGLEAPKENGWEQDTDTLDTWFSSGLWTFSTLGWPSFAETAKPGETGPENDFANYHPTTVLETGYDILFFWIARMILMSTYFIGDVPFKTVYLHGLVRDMQGRKMSKSLGNGIDPTKMAEKYGADAVRMSLIIGTGPGNDIRINEDKIRAYKKFANKVWNATRFVLERTEDLELDESQIKGDDKKIIGNWRAQLTDITEDIEKYRFYLAGEKLYHYFWHDFADVTIENLKKRLDDNKEDASAQQTLLLLLTEQLKALHPFMPFITEEVWQLMRKDDTMIMVEKWPNSGKQTD